MKNETRSAGDKILIYLLSIVVGFISTFILMLLFAFVSVTADLSDMFATPFASLSAAFGSVLSAYLSSRKLGSGGLLNGIICGGIMFLIIFLISLLIDDGGITINTLFNFIILLLSGIIGGVWGVNRKQKKII